MSGYEAMPTRASEEAEEGLPGLWYKAGHGISDGLDAVGNWFTGGNGPSPKNRKEEEAQTGLPGFLYKAGHTISDGLDSFGGLFDGLF